MVDVWSLRHLWGRSTPEPGQRLSSMKIYRFYADRDLLVDANLSTSVFPVVLADALDRALVSQTVPVPEVTTRTDFVAAKAS